MLKYCKIPMSFGSIFFCEIFFSAYAVYLSFNVVNEILLYSFSLFKLYEFRLLFYFDFNVFFLFLNSFWACWDRSAHVLLSCGRKEINKTKNYYLNVLFTQNEILLVLAIRFKIIR